MILTYNKLNKTNESCLGYFCQCTNTNFLHSYFLAFFPFILSYIKQLIFLSLSTIFLFLYFLSFHFLSLHFLSLHFLSWSKQSQRTLLHEQNLKFFSHTSLFHLISYCIPYFHEFLKLHGSRLNRLRMIHNKF